MSMDRLYEIIANLLLAMKRTDASLTALIKDRDNIQAQHDPVKVARTQFNAWRDSADGKQFKQSLYETQNGRCANPNCQVTEALTIDYLDIDHKSPIATHPQLALVKTNMHLLCTPCNRKKNRGGWTNPA